MAAVIIRLSAPIAAGISARITFKPLNSGQSTGQNRNPVRAQSKESSPRLT